MPKQTHYSVAEAADLLGYSAWMVRKFCRQGVLPSMRRAGTKRGKLFIPASAIDGFLKTQSI